MFLVHIIANIGPGGPARSLTTLVEWSARNAPQISHHVVTLDPRVYPPLGLRLRKAGAKLIRGIKDDELNALLTRADATLIHFWNTPLMWRLITRELPIMRSLIWTNVRGSDSPQRLNPNLLRSANAVAFTTKPPEHLLPDFAASPIIPGLVQSDRVAGLVPHPHDGFNIDYIGTANSGKLDPTVFSIIANLGIPNVKFRVYGGALETSMAQIHATMPSPNRVEIFGFTEDIVKVFATTDVFASPVAKNSYGSSDLAVQEAMLAGLPIVITAGSGPSAFITHNETGLVVSDAVEFQLALEELYRDPALRMTLGRAAQTQAQAEFASNKHPTRLIDLIDRVATEPKQPLFHTAIHNISPAALFLISQGWKEKEATVAIAAWLDGVTESLIEFATSATDACYKIEGGIVHWRNHEPSDPVLRALSGYWLRRCGRYENSQGEFAAAIRLGMNASAVEALMAA